MKKTLCKPLFEIMLCYLVPTHLWDSLAHKCLGTLQDLVMDAKYESEDDTVVVQEYLDILPKSLRLQLALRVQDKLRGKFRLMNPHGVYGHEEQWPKFLIWQAACFLPHVKDMPFVLKNVAFEHYSRYILEYLSNKWTENLKNSSITLGTDNLDGYTLQYEDLASHLQIILPRFVKLTEVTLGIGIQDCHLDIIGQTCKVLSKLTLTKYNKVTNDGFIRFAQHQRDNFCLQEIIMKCNRSPITLFGLSQIWNLPLSIKKLECQLKQLHFANDYIRLECSNGPAKLTHLTLDLRQPGGHWNGVDLLKDAKRVLDCKDAIFPFLKAMRWECPPHTWLTSGKTWNCVTWIDHPKDIPISLSYLDRAFPNLQSIYLSRIIDELPVLDVCFQHLERFNYCNSEHLLSFSMFSRIVRQITSLRVIMVEVAPYGADQYTDEAFCDLLQHCDHVKHLESLVLTGRSQGPGSRKLPLTIKSVECLIEKCPDIKLIGRLFDWSLNEEADENFLKMRFTDVVPLDLQNIYGHDRVKYLLG